MKKMVLKGSTLLELSLYVYLSYIMLPFLSVSLPPIIRTFIIMFIMASSIVLTTFVYPKRAGRMLILHLAIILFITIYYYGKGWYLRTDYIGHLTNSYMFWAALAFTYTIENWEYDRKKRLYNFLMLLIIITSITTIIGNIVYPMASRVLANNARENADMYLSKNIGPYGFIYGLIVMFPCIFIKSKSNKKYIFVIALIIAVQLVAQYSIAIIILIVLILFMSISPNYSLPRIAAISGLTAVSVFVFSPIFDKALIYIISLFEAWGFDMFTDRFSTLAYMFTYGDMTGDLSKRIDLYENSIYAFIKNPILGNSIAENTYELGGHSEILDTLGAGGIFAMFLCIAVMYKYVKSLGESEGPSLYSCRGYSFLAFIIVALFNPVFVSGNIAIAIFLFPMLMAQNDEPIN